MTKPTMAAWIRRTMFVEWFQWEFYGATVSFMPGFVGVVIAQRGPVRTGPSFFYVLYVEEDDDVFAELLYLQRGGM